MRTRLFFLIAAVLLLIPAGSGYGQARPASTPSLFGISGAIATPSAIALSPGRGTVGVWEGASEDSVDAVYFAYGIAEGLEVGLLSRIPSQAEAVATFFFKLNGMRQDRLFRGAPALAFGLHRENSFVAASYALRFVNATVGYNVADHAQGVFASAVLGPVRWFTVAGEYVRGKAGLSLRAAVRQAELALLYTPYTPQAAWGEHLLFWGLRYRF